MAELALFAVSANLIELVNIPKILDKLNVNKDVKKEGESMESWLGAMKAFIEDNAHNERSSNSLQHKVSQVRDIAFGIEDVLDEIVFHSKHVFHKHKITQKIHQGAHNTRHGFPHRGISEKIATINRKIDNLKSQAVALGSSSSNMASVNSDTLLSRYRDLSINLKSCFLYFGIFPEDYSVERGRLVRLWVAERFVTGTNRKTAEEVAEDCLDELIQRKLVDVSNRDFDGRPRNCRVLSPVLTFIIQKCKEEFFASVYPQENTSATNKIRRLSVHGDSSHLPRNSDFAVIRSLFFFRCGIFSTYHLGDNFRNFKLIGVLDLQGAPLTEFPEQITRLILLRYLSLRGTDIKTIPKSIKKLFYLKTLDLSQTGVTQLPKAVSRLHNLCHLFVYKYNVENFLAFHSVQGVEFSEGIGSLTNLQKLSLVKVGQKDGIIIRDLKKLGQLRKLGLTGIRREHGKALCASLQELKKLTTLDLCSNSEDEFLEVGEIQNPSSNIQQLYLKGRLKAFPGWISKLNNLLKIGLNWSKSKDCPLRALSNLPNLMEIQLVDCFEGDKLEFERLTFKKLKILLIENFSRLNTVVIEEGALPELRKMNLRRCPNLMMLPLGINKLSKIEELVLHDMAEEFIARLRKHSEDRQMVQHIPVIDSYTLNNQSWTLENLSGSFSA